MNTSPSFPSPRSQGRGPLSATAGTLVARLTSTRGGPRRCRPTNSGGRQPSANSSGNWSDGPRRHAGGGCSRSSAPPSAVVAVVAGGGGRSSSPRRTRTATTAAAPHHPGGSSAAPTAPAPAARRRSCPRSRRPRDLGTNCQYPARRRPASKPNKPPRTGEVPTDPAADQRQHVHRPGQHRPSARQRQGAVHGQQLRQPGPAGLLQRHPVPPADHQSPGLVGAAVRRPDRHRAPAARATSSPTSTRPTSTSPTTRAAAAGDLPARHAGDGQRRARHQRQPVLPGLQGFAAAARLHRVRHDRRRPAWPRWTRSPRRAWNGGGQDGTPKTPVTDQVDRAGLTPPGDAAPCRPAVRGVSARRTTRTAIRRPRPTNGMAIASLICAFLFAPLGIVFGHMSLSQIKRTGEEGHGLAVAGLVISYVVTVADRDRRGRPPSSSPPSPSAAPTTAIPATTRTSPRRRRHPAAAAAAVQAAGHARRQLPVPGHDRAGQQARQARRGRAASPPPRRRSAPASSPTRAPIGIQLDNGKAPCTVNSFVEPGPAGVLRRHARATG